MIGPRITRILRFVVVGFGIFMSCAPAVPETNQDWRRSAASLTGAPMLYPQAASPRDESLVVKPIDSDAVVSEAELVEAGLGTMVTWLRAAPPAGAPIPRRLSAETLRGLALTRGKTVLAAVKRNRAATSRLGQLLAIEQVASRVSSFRPSSGTGMGEMNEPMESSVQDGGMGGGGMGPDDGAIPYGMERLGAMVAHADVALARAVFAGEVWGEIERLDEAVFLVEQQRAKIAVLAKQQQLAQTAVEITKKNYENATAPLSTLLQNKSRAELMTIEYNAAKRQLDAALRSLSSVLDLDPTQLEGVFIETPHGLPPLPTGSSVLTYAQDFAPMIRMARAMAERMTAMRHMLRRQLFPNLTVETRLTAGAFPRVGDPWDFLVGSPYLTEVNLETNAMIADVSGTEKQVAAELTQMMAEWTEMVEMVTLNESHTLPRINKAVVVVYKEYQFGEADWTMLDEMLEMQRMVQLEIAEQRREVWSMWARIRTMAGGLP